MLTILFDGVAYGMLLFVLACGLSVTLGLMNFVNLAHGSFAMAGGYITVVLVNRMGVPFLLGLPLAFLFSAALGALLERTLYVHVYAKSHLDQVLFTIGLVFMSVAAVDYTMGSSQQFIMIPSALQGQIDVFGVGVGRYRLLIIGICAVLTIALQLILVRTRFGSRLRASVDDQRVARGLGINVGVVFGVTFAVGSGLAGLGGALGALLERTLYVHVYAKSHLDQVLFTIGLVFMSVAAVDYTMGSSQQFIVIPSALQGQIDMFGVGVGRYRLLIIGICAVLTIALQLILTRTRFGSRLRASVDDQRVARGLGINVGVVFGLTFAVGSGLAGLGGALGAEILGLDPVFPLKYMIYFLIVVTVGGTSSIIGPFLASILLGIGDVAGKYYVPQVGAFVIYTIMIVVLIWRPQGLFARQSAR